MRTVTVPEAEPDREGRPVTAYTQPDYQRAEGQDANQVTATPQTLQREHDDGAATAWKMTEHSAANGHSADHIEQRHDEPSGPAAGQAERTPAESSWWSGYKSGADGSVSLLRELLEQEKEPG